MSARPPQETVWELARGALAARALGIAADLGVAEALSPGRRSVDELAREVGADPDSLYRIMRALASVGVFTEEEPRTFGNTESSELLRAEWKDFAHLFGGVFHRAAAGLDASGVPGAFARAHGTDFWSWLAAEPEERAAFDRAMAQGVEGRIARLDRLEWRGDETVVDVGGGNGALLEELLSRHDGLRGIVFDLPETDRDESTFGERCTFVAGSFFERVPRGDVYVLSTILHDWDDERATAILRTIRAAAPPDARLVVVDAVIRRGENQGAQWLDLLMLALLDGRERDEEQWRTLLAAGGFEPVRIEPDGLIEARCR